MGILNRLSKRWTKMYELGQAVTVVGFSDRESLEPIDEFEDDMREDFLGLTGKVTGITSGEGTGGSINDPLYTVTFKGIERSFQFFGEELEQPAFWKRMLDLHNSAEVQRLRLLEDTSIALMIATILSPLILIKPTSWLCIVYFMALRVAWTFCVYAKRVADE
jgi:hypothetical protein